MIRLDIGCGDYCEPGWTGVDPYYPGAAVTAPAWQLPYEDGRVAAIRCSHCLEHIEREYLGPTFNEWYRALKPNGTVWVAVPDSFYILQYLLDHGDADSWGHIMVWGQGRWQGDAHVTAFAPDTLVNDVVASGLVVDSVRREWTGPQNQISIILEAHRP